MEFKIFYHPNLSHGNFTARKFLNLQFQLCTGARFGKKSILYTIWFLSPPGFQQYIGLGLGFLGQKDIYQIWNHPERNQIWQKDINQMWNHLDRKSPKLGSKNLYYIGQKIVEITQIG